MQATIAQQAEHIATARGFRLSDADPELVVRVYALSDGERIYRPVMAPLFGDDPRMLQEAKIIRGDPNDDAVYADLDCILCGLGCLMDD